MEELTIDEIKHPLPLLRGDVEELERMLDRVFGRLDGALRDPRRGAAGGRVRELGEAPGLELEPIERIGGIQALATSS